MEAVYHAGYWECVPWIAASGELSESDSDNSLGEREFHGVTGIYTSPAAMQVRYDPEKQCTMGWARFQADHCNEPEHEVRRRWYQLPRRVETPRARDYYGSVYTWNACCKQWSLEWEMNDLYDWFCRLPRVG